MSASPARQKRAVRRVSVCDAAELPPGTRRIIVEGGRSIGIFNVDGEFFAVRNRCPHQGGPLCLGITTGLWVGRLQGDEMPRREVKRDGEILRCPWHAWEFDLRTGEAVFGEGWRVATYPAFAHPGASCGDEERPPRSVETYATTVERGTVIVELPA